MARKKNIEKLPGIVVGALADAFNTHFISIERWAAKGDDRLTSDKAKSVYAQLNWEFTPERYIDKELVKAV